MPESLANSEPSGEDRHPRNGGGRSGGGGPRGQSSGRDTPLSLPRPIGSEGAGPGDGRRPGERRSRGRQVPGGDDLPGPAALGNRRRGPAGPGFGLERRDMAAGGRLEDVSARQGRAAGAEPPSSCAGRAGRGLREEATRNPCGRGGRRGRPGAGGCGGRSGCAARPLQACFPRWRPPRCGGPRQRPAHVLGASSIPELRASRDARLA